MNLLLISIALTLPMAAQQATQPRPKYNEKMPVQKLDGEWAITYAEIDGKKMEGKGFTEVTIKNNVVSCRHDGKTKSWRLEFGPHNMIRCTEMIDGKNTVSPEDKRDPNEKGYYTHYGVYIASPEYFCLAMNRGMDRRSLASTTERREGEARTAQAGAGPRFGEQGRPGRSLRRNSSPHGRFTAGQHALRPVQRRGRLAAPLFLHPYVVLEASWQNPCPHRRK